MAGKTPEWESDLWSYLSSGDGKHCPLINHCESRNKHNWCGDETTGNVNRLLDGEHFNINSPGFQEMQPESGRQCRIFQLVERLAGSYIKVGGVRCPPVPSALAMLADQQHTVEVRLLPLKVYHGSIWYTDNTWIIQLNADDTPAQRKFYLFHEAFHILAHCKTTPGFKKRGNEGWFFTEHMADYFAACILMPREWVVGKWAEVQDIERMTEIFEVPETLMGLRLRQLGLI